MKYNIHTQISDKPLDDVEAKQVIKDLQPLIVDIVVNGMRKLKARGNGDSPII